MICVIRTPSRVVVSPGMTTGYVDTNQSEAPSQTASVGRPSTAEAIVLGEPGCRGAGGVANARIVFRSAGLESSTGDGSTPGAFGFATSPVISAYVTSPSAKRP